MVEKTITEADFRELIAVRGRRLLSIAGCMSQPASSRPALTRPLVGELLSQSTQIEELLDAYGARNNCRWYPFRSLAAAMKLFTEVAYELLHIHHALPSYRLLPIDQDFMKDTQEALVFAGDVLVRSATQTVERARTLGLPGWDEPPGEDVYAERLPPGRLPRDRDTRSEKTVAETVAYLATAFLNLAAESQVVHIAGRTEPQEYACCIPNPVSEASLRSLQDRFHNLQSAYDTYVSQTEAEGLDPDLPVLRGHVSVAFHLLKIATALVHYYERHMSNRSCDSEAHDPPIVDSQSLLSVMMDYSLGYTSRYIGCAEWLCQAMLRRYAEIGRIETPVPRYRGFHVRPSTLVAKIVLHYGSDVRMELEGDSYDASTPLEIFRANEKINARKRRWLASQIACLPLVWDDCEGKDARTATLEAVLVLAEHGKLVLYEQPLHLPDEPARMDGTLMERVVAEVARLQATGKLDIETDLNITFIGDKRVLADLELLANSGYGEDNFGNNIPLPEELRYLRR